MYDPSDTITLTIPRHTAHLLNSLAVSEHRRLTPKLAYNPKNQQQPGDDMKALEDYIRAYADAAQRR